MSKAYAYLRVSSKEQLVDGKDGMDRQLASIKRMADFHDVSFDSIQIYEDRGVSGYTGRNAEKGQLKELIDDIERLDIKAGDVIFVESLDRLSRQRLLETKDLLYNKILSKGVLLITTCDGYVYKIHEGGNEQLQQDTLINVIVVRANEESRIKSLRRKSAWNKAKDEAKVNKKPFNAHNPPFGIVYNKEKNVFEINEKEQEVIKDIFTSLSVRGLTDTRKLIYEKYGIETNNKKIKLMFDTKYILGFLCSQKRVNGKKEFIEYIPNYYPKLIDELTYQRALEGIKGRYKRKEYGRNIENDINIFKYCVKCCYCGSSLIVERSKNSCGSIYYYFNCKTNRNVPKSCELTRIRFDYVFASFLLLNRDVVLYKNLLESDKTNEISEENKERILNEYNKIKNIFINLLHKDDNSNIRNEIDKIENELSIKKQKYDNIRKIYDRFMKIDGAELDDQVIIDMSILSKEIKALNEDLNILFLKEKEEFAELKNNSYLSLIDLYKTTEGRLTINNYLIRNNIKIVVDYKNKVLKVDYYKDDNFITSKSMEFDRLDPLLKYFEGIRDISDLIELK